jgi:hypothetical protein
MLCLADGVGGTDVFSRSMSASTEPVKLVNPRDEPGGDPGQQDGLRLGARLMVNSTLGPGMAITTLTTVANASTWLSGTMGPTLGRPARPHQLISR